MIRYYDPDEDRTYKIVPREPPGDLSSRPLFAEDLSTDVVMRIARAFAAHVETEPTVLTDEDYLDSVIAEAIITELLERRGVPVEDVPWYLFVGRDRWWREHLPPSDQATEVKGSP